MTFPPDVSQSEWNKVLAQTEQARRDAVYDAAMDWMGELEALFGGMTLEELEKDMTPCVRTLYRVCRRAKEGR